MHTVFKQLPFTPASAIGHRPELSNQNASQVAGAISPAVLQRLALLEIFSFRAGRILPTLALVIMKTRVVFHPSSGCRAGLCVTIQRGGPNRVKKG